MCGKHVGNAHRTVPKSKEQSILCKLGRDRICLDDLPLDCPVRGCNARLRHLLHHFKNCHREPSPARTAEELRPLRRCVVFTQLRELRRAGEPMVTDLDTVYFRREGG